MHFCPYYVDELSFRYCNLNGDRDRVAANIHPLNISGQYSFLLLLKPLVVYNQIKYKIYQKMNFPYNPLVCYPDAFLRQLLFYSRLQQFCAFRWMPVPVPASPAAISPLSIPKLPPPPPVPFSSAVAADSIDQKLDQILATIKRGTTLQPEDGRERRQRVRKSAEQVEALRREAECGGKFTTERVKALAARTGLSKSQVYKWYWDSRRRTRKETTLISNNRISPGQNSDTV